jgi:predicted nucleic acid-binding protein
VVVALDSEAFNALAGPDSQRKRRLRRILRAAHQLGRDVLVPTLVLAELYRGHGHNQLVDACLARERASATPIGSWPALSGACWPRPVRAAR